MSSPVSITIASPLGPLEIEGGPQGVRAIRLLRPPGSPPAGAGASDDGFRPLTTSPGPVQGAAAPQDIPVPVREAAEQLSDYFSGRRRRFDFALDLRGTPFQVAVWNCLMAIPFGETRSYRWVAQAVGRPAALRAVGAAVGRNPLLIAVPCHRVIASDGTLGGFACGLDVKRLLLRLEGLDAVASMRSRLEPGRRLHAAARQGALELEGGTP